MKKVIFFIYPTLLFADSYDDFVYEVAASSNTSTSITRKCVSETFKTIQNRMLEDRATSIPGFGRFSTSEKEKKSQKDSNGFWLSPKIVKTPKFTAAKELKLKLEQEK